nr:unnamed protein product [Spirometra erinaceieuropaei]
MKEATYYHFANANSAREPSKRADINMSQHPKRQPPAQQRGSAIDEALYLLEGEGISSPEPQEDADDSFDTISLGDDTPTTVPKSIMSSEEESPKKKRPRRSARNPYDDDMWENELNLSTTSHSQSENSESSSTLPLVASPKSKGHKMSRTERKRRHMSSREMRRKFRGVLRWLINNSKENTKRLERVELKLDARAEGRASAAISLSTSTSVAAPFRRMACLSDLERFTNKLTDTEFRQQMVSHLASFGGRTLSAFVDRVFSALFQDEITHHLTFYGRQHGKSAFFGSPTYSLVLGIKT